MLSQINAMRPPACAWEIEMSHYRSDWYFPSYLAYDIIIINIKLQYIYNYCK